MSTVSNDETQQQTKGVGRGGNQPNQTIDWTGDRVGELKRLWAAGATQAEIADAFGVTRNVIAGKISRLKLTRKPSEPKPRTGRKQYPKKQNPALAWTRRPKPEPLPPEPAPVAGGVQLMDLTNAACRWPSGTVGADDFCFCGVPTADLNAGKPYCREHTNLARRT
jgi:GcrA cell cycle regulator